MRLIFLLVSVTTAMAAGTGQGFSGSFSQGNGQGYGYGGSYSSGPGSSSSSGGLPQGFPQGFPQFDFNNLLDQYYQVFTKFNQDLAATRISAYSYSITNADSNSKAMAKSSITFNRKGFQNQPNAFAAGGYGFPGGYPAFASGGYGGVPNFGGQGGSPSYATGGYGGGFSSSGGQPSSAGGNPSYASGGYGGSFSNVGGQQYAGGSPSDSSGGYGGGFSNSGGQGASASASVGPGGSHQTANVYPANPNIPNVNTRFGASPGGSSYGVFTSSQSVSSNIDGKPTSQHTAQTTINDNGKVTSYTVHNP